jgi:protein O-GlcNAc transferase
MLLSRLLGAVFARRGAAPGGERVARAVQLMHEGRLAEAGALLQAALDDAPQDAGPRQLLASIALRQGRAADALAQLEAIAGEPSADTLFMRAEALTALARVEEALAAYESLRARFPAFAAGHAAHGTLLSSLGRWDDAVAALREADRLGPGSAAILNNLGNALKEIGEMRAALRCFEAALASAPEFFDARQSRYFCMHYLPEATPQELFAAAREFNDLYGAPLAAAAAPHPNRPDPERTLRIGYVSGDFRRHPGGYFIEPVIDAHDRALFHTTCYSTSARADDLTQRIAARADCWRAVESMDDAALADAVRADAIDILVDLSGHTRGHRLLAFARRPAPVQATWFGFLDTTGLDAIDYIIVDPLLLPPAGSAQRFAERPLVLPRSYLCYRPPEYAPEVTPPPVLRRGAPTFGCFNNLAKLNERAIALWARLLAATPGSRLVLCTHAVSLGRSRDWLAARFAAHGIRAARLELRGGAPHRELLAAYGEIDVALDPFPYGGGLSTLEALWMGVPVITLAGATIIGRMGATYVGHAGLDEFVAATPDAYLEIARRAAADPARLAELRAGMRARLLGTTLLDGAAFTRDLEEGYRRVWRDWCAGPREVAIHALRP